MVSGQVLHGRGTEEGLISLNVGGFRQKVCHGTLLRFPQTRLGRLLHCQSEAAILELCDDYCAANGEYYFDRNPTVFRCVLSFYRTGRIHLMEDLCVFSFSQEIEYWGIMAHDLGPCCGQRYLERKENVEDGDCDVSEEQPLSLGSSLEVMSVQDKDLEDFEGTWCSELRRNVWLTMEDPGHSRLSKAVTFTSIGVVLTSIVAMCIHSMPESHEVEGSDRYVEDPVLATIEMVCIIFFSVEFSIRLAAAPRLRKFLASPLNIIDFFSILPFYATLMFEAVDKETDDLENVGKVVQILRLMRILRVLKLARHSVGLRALGTTLRHSYQEVGMLVLFLSVGICIFSVLMHFLEREQEVSQLQSIPAGWWWATISMTTVGYGDACPVTPAGKLVASLCIISGLLVVALPISIIFNKFFLFYQNKKVIYGDQCDSDSQSLYFDIGDVYDGKVNSFSYSDAKVDGSHVPAIGTSTKGHVH